MNRLPRTKQEATVWARHLGCLHFLPHTVGSLSWVARSLASDGPQTLATALWPDRAGATCRKVLATVLRLIMVVWGILALSSAGLAQERARVHAVVDLGHQSGSKRRLATSDKIPKYDVHATVAVLSVALGRDLFPWFNEHGIEADPAKSSIPPITEAPTLRPRGHVLFHADFEGTNAMHGWAGTGKLETGYRSQVALAFGLKPDAGGRTDNLSVELPAESMRGYLVRGSAMVRAENVSAKPNPWNGIKCMLAIETPERKLWPQATIETGTFDWRRVTFTARIPTNATSVRLVLGLEQVNGKAWFDDVTVAVAKPPVRRETRPVVGPPFTGQDLPRLRGAMISPDIDAAGLRVLGREWNANLIRWQLIRRGRPGQPSALEDYDTWLEGELNKLDAALPLCRENGLYVVVDLHSPPGGKGTSGGYVGSDDRFFTDPACQAKFIQVWQRIAARYKGAQPIWGYDLVNEPVEDFVAEECDDWQALAERAARAIRAIDPVRTIIVEPASWGGPGGLTDLAPLPVSNVVYSVHMYMPHAFTHQGVHGDGPAWRYPGVIDGTQWDKAALEGALKPVVEFQQAYGVRIYIGEFSAIRWAPDDSARRYLADLIEIFEGHGWDWSYHAFREWSGWSAEHDSDRNNPKPSAEPTSRQRLLQQWFKQNRKTRRLKSHRSSGPANPWTSRRWTRS